MNFHIQRPSSMAATKMTKKNSPIINKTTVNSDVLMNKLLNMGIGNSTIAAGSGNASSKMTNQTPV